MNSNAKQLTRRDFFGIAGAASAFIFALPGSTALAVEPQAPASEPIRLIPETHVAGTSHILGIAPLANALCADDRLTLEREPENPFDCWAIRVHDEQGNKLGFIPRAQNQVVARLMDGGKHVFAKVTGVELINRWFKIGIEVWLDD